MKVIPYKDKFYIQVTPVKRLFNSTTVHEVVTRGDIFAVDIASKELTVLPRSALEKIVEMEITQLVSPLGMVKKTKKDSCFLYGKDLSVCQVKYSDGVMIKIESPK